MCKKTGKLNDVVKAILSSYKYASVKSYIRVYESAIYIREAKDLIFKVLR